MKTQKIKKLSQSVINQIAAGEIIDRPRSVVKELIDNAIDAQATKIDIQVEKGGIQSITVTDNGVGIDKGQLKTAFESHTTSKITTLDDLNTLITMGFRGEALATIKAVSQTTIISQPEDSDVAYKLTFNSKTDKTSKPEEPTKTAHNQGTTIKVENLFADIPARKKYLKSSQTEYRHIIKTITPYFLIHPEVHFTFQSDERKVYNLPAIDGTHAGTIHPSRIKELIKSEFTKNLINFYYEGNSINIGGLSAHPSFHTARTTHQYIFVNQRPIYDSGIIRAVLQAYYRFIPKGTKIPFFITINIKPELVDFNVHPRKETVKFINPYRVYSSIEESVKQGLKREVNQKFQGSYTSSDSQDDIGFNRLRNSANPQTNKGQQDFSTFKEPNAKYIRTKSGQPKNISFRKTKPSDKEVQQSLRFTRELLQNNEPSTSSNTADHTVTSTAAQILDTPINQQVETDNLHIPFQVFNKYIILQQIDTLWIIDQHAAAERITFEKLQTNLKSQKKLTQQLLLPEQLNLTEEEFVYFKEHASFFEQLGFRLKFVKKTTSVKAVKTDKTTVQHNTVQILSIPVLLIQSGYQKLFQEMFTQIDSLLESATDFETSQDSIIATLACHTSIRAGQKLHAKEMQEIIKDLMKCKNPYSCPHGRPLLWELSLKELDKKFDRG